MIDTIDGECQEYKRLFVMMGIQVVLLPASLC